MVYDPDVIGVVATDRASAHLAEQIAVKAMFPVVAISSDRTLTSTNVPWIFRLDRRDATVGCGSCAQRVRLASRSHARFHTPIPGLGPYRGCALFVLIDR